MTIVVCTGTSSNPHEQSTVIGSYSATKHAWVYNCTKCGYDVHVPRELMALAIDRSIDADTTQLNLHILATMKTGGALRGTD